MKDPLKETTRDRQHLPRDRNGQTMPTGVIIIQNSEWTNNLETGNMIQLDSLWTKRQGVLLYEFLKNQSQPPCSLSGEKTKKGKGEGRGGYASFWCTLKMQLNHGVL